MPRALVPAPTRRACVVGAAFFLSSFTLAACGHLGGDDALATVAAGDYRLGPGDKLRVTVYGEPDLTHEYVVGPQGLIAFPLIGEIQAGGLTVPEFTANLTRSLGAQYIRNPNVSVEVLDYRPFYILGEVQRPGTYPYSANLVVMNAVATAGGFTYRANTSRVYIKHAGEAREREYRLESTTPVMPGDTVRIGERLF